MYVVTQLTTLSVPFLPVLKNVHLIWYLYLYHLGIAQVFQGSPGCAWKTKHWSVEPPATQGNIFWISLHFCMFQTCYATQVTVPHAYLIWWVFVRNFQCLHSPDHRMHGHKYILVDKLDEASFIFFCVSTTVNDTHLLDECGFAGLSSPWKDTDNLFIKTSNSSLVSKLTNLFHLSYFYCKCKHFCEMYKISWKGCITFTPVQLCQHLNTGFLGW